ncbi:hypothetical protein A2442_01195 [Candidatus Campbellbacteria bacterium RIFOXYC2_FULL_35_25]|uniref:Cell shape-determining protein MreC n=1 Tax=Candidatus Campbellbacteria bacterium RIFOXYC2_FULL_35_25 TaxID=1797582 RepID=A0A1F5EH28_9BACT|nr:MAG: hypothetical protein A2442_01195 [Candidatus Campbellbacteria bacterium RIFOXYC2_FULL_35_25]
MMSYLSRDSKKKKNKLFLVLLLAVVLFFYSQILNILGGVFDFIVYPIWVTENKIDEKTISPLGFFVSKKTLIVSNEQLKKDINEAEAMLVGRNALVKENLELKEILGRVSNPENFILASVLSKPNSSLYDILVVDAGNNLNIKKGSKVFASGNILIGEVFEVSEKSSKVRLYSSSKERVGVNVGLFNISTDAFGRGAGNFEIKLPRDTDIELGDPITSLVSSLQIVGSVEEINTDPIDSFKTILFKSPINIFELKWVQISKTE